MSRAEEISLLGASEMRQLATSLGLSPSKSLGQNFVHDSNICEKIVRLAEIKEGDLVIEVGPGLGSLSLSIARAGARLIAVEIDKRLAERLPSTLLSHGVSKDSFVVVTKDAMDLRVEDLTMRPGVGGAIRLVANLPYNVSVPVLLHILKMEVVSSAMVMVQSEVAERLAAHPGTREYGVPSAKVAWYADARLRDQISRSVFWPIPRVDSALLDLTVHPPLATDTERDLTFEIIDTAFNQRRKMLRSSLVGYVESLADGMRVEEVLEGAGVDPTARPESLDIHAFLSIARAIAPLHA